MKCHYCGAGPEKDEMRPYGPGGSWIHFDCMMADPAREQAAKLVFAGQLTAAGDIAVIGEETGPRPLTPGKG